MMISEVKRERRIYSGDLRKLILVAQLQNYLLSSSSQLLIISSIAWISSAHKTRQREASHSRNTRNPGRPSLLPRVTLPLVHSSGLVVEGSQSLAGRTRPEIRHSTKGDVTKQRDECCI